MTKGAFLWLWHSTAAYGPRTSPTSVIAVTGGTSQGPYADISDGHYEVRTDCRKPADFAVALYCGIGSSSLNALVCREKKRNFVGQHFWARGYYLSTVGRDETVIFNDSRWKISIQHTWRNKDLAFCANQEAIEMQMMSKTTNCERWCGRRDLNPHGPFKPCGFSYRLRLSPPGRGALGGLTSGLRSGLSLHPPPEGPELRCCPSSLYTFPAGVSPGLARDCHLRFPRI